MQETFKVVRTIPRLEAVGFLLWPWSWGGSKAESLWKKRKMRVLVSASMWWSGKAWDSVSWL